MNVTMVSSLTMTMLVGTEQKLESVKTASVKVCGKRNAIAS